jgi:antitoxin ParD1/3/4
VTLSSGSTYREASWLPTLKARADVEYDYVIPYLPALEELMSRKSRPVTVTLGDLQTAVEARVKSGAYASVSEVMRAAVRALDREEAAINEWLRRCVDEALADPSPDVPARQVFRRLRTHHAKQLKARRSAVQGQL